MSNAVTSPPAYNIIELAPANPSTSNGITRTETLGHSDARSNASSWARATTKWATGPFDCGARGWTAQRTYPMVIGPDNLPVITDERTAARKPAMAVFSALAHANSNDINLGDTPAGDKWREILSFVTYFPGRGTVRETAYLEGKAEGKAEGKVEGVAEGEAKGVLRVLEVRGLTVSDDVRTRITTCTDLDRLGDWLDRAGTVAHAEELFGEAPHSPESTSEQS